MSVEERAPAGADSNDQVDLAQMIDDAAAIDELHAQNEPVGQTLRESAQQVQADVSAPDPIADLRKRFDDREAEWKQERAQLYGMISRGQQQQPQVVVQQPPAAPAAKPEPTEAELLESLNKNPLGTIRSLISDTVAKTRQEMEQELGGRVERVRAETLNEQNRRVQVQQDYETVRTEHADIYGNSQLAQEFDTEAGQELARIIGLDSRGQIQWQNFRPGDATSAAARVAMRWSRAGKLPTNNNNGSTNGLTNGSIREVVRSRPAARTDRPAVGGRTTVSGTTEPRTVAELNFSGAEQRAALKIMRDMGLNEATYVANYLASKRDNPGFGEG